MIKFKYKCQAQVQSSQDVDNQFCKKSFPILKSVGSEFRQTECILIQLAKRKVILQLHIK